MHAEGSRALAIVEGGPEVGELSEGRRPRLGGIVAPSPAATAATAVHAALSVVPAFAAAALARPVGRSQALPEYVVRVEVAMGQPATMQVLHRSACSGRGARQRRSA